MLLKTFADYQINVSGGSGEVAAVCPECSHDRKKSSARCLSVNVDKGVWNCNHCGWKGGLNNDGKIINLFLMKSKSMYPKPDYEWQGDLPEKVYNFLVDERCISEEVLKRNQVGAEGDWIMFPFFKSGECVNIKYRGPEKRFRQFKDAEKIVYGYDDIADTTIIVEGEIDKLSLEAAGFRNCVSCPDGAPAVGTKSYSSKFEFLDNCEARFNEVKEFVIAVDNDGPGHVLEQELSRRLGLGRCLKVLWPDGCKDANDVLVKHGADRLRQCIDTAKPYPIEGIIWASDLDMQGYYEHGDHDGLSTGWDALDKFYMIAQDAGDLTVVTGIPGHGKSEFLDAMMINLTNSEGWLFGVFSPENYPLQSYVAKLSEKYIGLPFREGFKRRMTVDEVDKAQTWINDHIFFLDPPEDDLTVDAILSLAKTLVYRKGINGLIIDPWNELDHSRPTGITETDYISQCLSKIRRFSRNHNIHIWLVAHPTKMQKEEGGHYPCPTPYSISGSAHWYNKADNCFAIWRDFSDESGNCSVEIHVQKIRQKLLGRLGKVKLNYEYSTGRYAEPS